MTLVLDSSVAVAFVIEAERTPPIVAVLERVSEEGAWTPSLWRYEVANALQTAVRRGRYTDARRDASLKQLAKLPIETDRDGEAQAWKDTLQLTLKFGLTIYDAAYLELAVRRNLPLASGDQQLVAAAARAGVAIL